MKTHYRLIRRGQRGGTFYYVDTHTARRISLRKANEDAARQIVAAKTRRMTVRKVAKAAANTSGWQLPPVKRSVLLRSEAAIIGCTRATRLHQSIRIFGFKISHPPKV